MKTFKSRLSREEMRNVMGGVNPGGPGGGNGNPPNCVPVESACNVNPCCNPYVCKNVVDRGWVCQVWTPA